MNYNEMTVSELRKLVTERKLGAGVWRVSASKADLILALETGNVPDAEPTPPRTGNLAETLATAIREFLPEGTVNEEKVREIVSDELGRRGALKIELQIAELPPVDVSEDHFLLPLVLACVHNKIPVYLVGPAGSGKTHLAKRIAKMLQMEYSDISVCGQTSEYSLRGYMDAQGRYVSTGFRTRYEQGGVFLLDEADAGNPNVLAVLNSGTANGHMSFPDGLIAKHDNFRLIAAGNTYGTGANAQYVGRNPLDAATLDRFAFIQFPIDPSLEGRLIGVDVPKPDFDISEGGTMDGKAWIERVQALRENAQRHGVKAIFSPRATIYGTLLLSSGVGIRHVENMLLRKGLDESTWTKLQS
jgi:MoxR-like ATPase